jgi:hypothetical protein
MKLKKDSLLRKLYRWYYVDNLLPTSFCPYFHSLIRMFIFIIPYVIISLPFIIGSIFIKGWRVSFDEKYNYPSSLITSTSDRVGFGIVFYIIILFCLFFLLPLYSFVGEVEVNSNLDKLIFSSKIIWGIGFMALFVLGFIKGIIYVSNKFKTKHKNKQIVYKEKSPNIIVEFVKATYNKYCPKIDWV